VVHQAARIEAALTQLQIAELLLDGAESHQTSAEPLRPKELSQRMAQPVRLMPPRHHSVVVGRRGSAWTSRLLSSEAMRMLPALERAQRLRAWLDARQSNAAWRLLRWGRRYTQTRKAGNDDSHDSGRPHSRSRR